MVGKSIQRRRFPCAELWACSLKDGELEPRLGELLSDMLIALSDRGPDSAGIAIYGPPNGKTKITVQSQDPSADFSTLAEDLAASGLNASVAVKDTHAVIETDADAASARRLRSPPAPDVRVMSSGESVEIYKEVGLPKKVVARFGIRSMARHARHRPHADGDRIGGHHARRASFLDRAGPVPRPQRLAVQPQQSAPRAACTKA